MLYLIAECSGKKSEERQTVGGGGGDGGGDSIRSMYDRSGAPSRKGAPWSINENPCLHSGRCCSRLGRVDALGFALLRRKTEGLKHEYRELDSKEIGALK